MQVASSHTTCMGRAKDWFKITAEDCKHPDPKGYGAWLYLQHMKEHCIRIAPREIQKDFDQNQSCFLGYLENRWDWKTVKAQI